MIIDGLGELDLDADHSAIVTLDDEVDLAIERLARAEVEDSSSAAWVSTQTHRLTSDSKSRSQTRRTYGRRSNSILALAYRAEWHPLIERIWQSYTLPIGSPKRKSSGHTAKRH